jgi:lipid II:glycine glycyltransferase (peptidoglycan interpeptide bridge formation enzyme)
MLSALTKESRNDKLRYIEIRPTQPLDSATLGFHLAETYRWHRIDLSPTLNQLFRNCHKDSTQRKIRRAEREGLTLNEGGPADNLDSFYRLLVLTRRRHFLPPQPKKWFHSLIDAFGTALRIRVAFKDRQPIAAILTLRYRDVLTYKYGCSDPQFHHLGGMHLLLWTAIEEAKKHGMSWLDLGRSDCDDHGLITFKERWGAKCALLTYLRWSPTELPRKAYVTSASDSKLRTVRTLMQYLPDPVLRVAGTLFYKHAG